VNCKPDRGVASKGKAGWGELLEAETLWPSGSDENSSFVLTEAPVGITHSAGVHCSSTWADAQDGKKRKEERRGEERREGGGSRCLREP
jgi:hypothetical protein